MQFEIKQAGFPIVEAEIKFLEGGRWFREAQSKGS